jgi:hypothetical protein
LAQGQEAEEGEPTDMKTVSLELSKQLKEAGCPQETHFVWNIFEDHTLEGGHSEEERASLVTHEYASKKPVWKYSDDFHASPTADEILDQLPIKIEVENTYWELTIEHHFSGVWGLRYGFEVAVTGLSNGSLADAAALMWLFLKKEGLL